MASYDAFIEPEGLLLEDIRTFWPTNRHALKCGGCDTAKRLVLNVQSDLPDISAFALFPSPSPAASTRSMIVPRLETGLTKHASF
jgi:hypothetical protein